MGGQGSREEMLIFLFLLFAETVSGRDNQKENNMSIDSMKSFQSKEFLGFDKLPSYGNNVLLPVGSEYSETLDSSSSPREITLRVGSPRTSCSRNTIDMIEECGDIFALTSLGLDCLVRFLILSQASMESADMQSIKWANSILDSETHLYHQKGEEKGIVQNKVLYTFAINGMEKGQEKGQGQGQNIDHGHGQGVSDRQGNGRQREALVTCSNRFALPSAPITLPVFLSLFNVASSEIELEDPFDGPYAINIFIPDVDSDCNISEVVLSTSNLLSSLSLFMEDVNDVYSASVREECKGKQQQKQLDDFITLYTRKKSIEVKDETEMTKSSILPLDSTDSDLNGSIGLSTRNSRNINKSVAPENSTIAFFGPKPNSPKNTIKHRKSINTRVISPTFVVPVITVDGSQSSQSINDYDHSSTESGATDTTIDSSSITDTCKNNLSSISIVQKNGANVPHPTLSPSFSSSILAALSFSSHGAPTHTSTDGLIPSNTTRNKLTTGGLGTVHPSMQSTELANISIDPLSLFVSSACGLVNLGNTCFMSSALQCLVHSPLVKEYFMSNKFRNHLNVRNPLGTKGVLTEEFASLIESMWGMALKARIAITSGQVNHNLYKRQSKPQISNGNSLLSLTSLGTPLAPCFAPFNFKRVLQTCKSQFQGQEQQDVQEFLAELMVNLI